VGRRVDDGLEGEGERRIGICSFGGHRVDALGRGPGTTRQ
jgi:hypothetical protein